MTNNQNLDENIKPANEVDGDVLPALCAAFGDNAPGATLDAYRQKVAERSARSEDPYARSADA